MKKKQRKKLSVHFRARELVSLIRNQQLCDSYMSVTRPGQHESVLFKDFAEVFLENRKISQNRKDLIGYALKYIHPIVGKSRLEDITESDCISIIQMLENKLSSGTANLYFAIFTSIMNYAVKRGYISSNPVKRIDATDKIHPIYRERAFLTEVELKRVIAIHDQSNTIEKAFLFSCFCGLRKCDIYRIRWCDIRDDGLGGMQLYLIQKKTKTPLYLPLSEQCCQFLPQKDALSSDTSEIFPKKFPCQIKPALRRMMDRAGVTKEITFHSARHTFATLLLTKGADIYTTSKLLGHTNVKTTAIYAKIIDEKKRKTVDLLNNI